MSPEQLAVATGLSFSTIAKFRSGVIRPSLSSLGRLADALGCSVAMFFDEDTPDLAADDDPRPTDLGPGVDEWVRVMLASMPPMSTDQARRVSASLFGTARPRTDRRKAAS